MCFLEKKYTKAHNNTIENQTPLSYWPLFFRDPKDPAVTRERVERVEREDRRDTEASLVCRVCPDLR